MKAIKFIIGSAIGYFIQNEKSETVYTVTRPDSLWELRDENGNLVREHWCRWEIISDLGAKFDSDLQAV